MTDNVEQNQRSLSGAAGAAVTTRCQRHPGSLLDENAEHLLCERATMERIKARRLLLPDLAHNDAPTVPDSAATRESTAAFAAAQKRLDTMPTGVHVLVPAQIVSSRR